MKQIIISILVVFMVMLQGGVSFSEPGSVGETVIPFLKALQDGDREALMENLDGQLLQDITTAFTTNPNYGSFLRNRYTGATFTTALVKQSENQEVVRVDVTYSGNKTSTFELLAQQNAEGIWHIIDQYSSLK